MSTDTDKQPSTGWRATPAVEPVDKSPRRVFGAFAALLVCVGGFLAVSNWATPRPRSAFASYLAPAPGGPPAIVRADHVAAGRAILGRLPDEPASSRTVFDARLKALPSGRPAVVYISAAATCTPDGRVMILPSDVRADTPQAGFPLREILTLLANSPSHRKLLLLDLSWPADSIPASVASGAVSAAIVEELDAIPDDGRLTLASCTPGQTARSADELGHTAFGYYVGLGLAGWAAPPGADSVTAYGLASYVRIHVERWAVQVSGARQTPVLLGEGEDFPLVPLAGRPLVAAPELPEPVESTDWLRPHWAARDRLRAAGADRVDPLAMRALGEELLAAERADRAGISAADRRAVGDQVARIVARCETALAFRPFVPPNLVAIAPPTDSTIAPVVRAALVSPPGAKPEEYAATFTAAETKLAAVPPLSAARLVLDLLTERRTLDREVVVRANDVIAALKPRPNSIELVFLDRLAGTARKPETVWDGELAARALAVHRLGESTLDSLSFSAFNRILESAAAARYRGEELLLAADFVSPASAESPLAAAGTLYAVAHRAQDAARTADRELAEALRLLTSTVRIAADSTDTYSNWRDLHSATRAAIETREKLGGATSDEIAQTALALEQASRRLALRLAPIAAPFQPEAIKSLIEVAHKTDAKLAVLKDLDAILATDRPVAETRSQLKAARSRLIARLIAGVLESDDLDGPLATVARPAAPSLVDQAAERTLVEREVAALAALAELSGQRFPEAPLRTPAERGERARDLSTFISTVPAGLADVRRDRRDRTIARAKLADENLSIAAEIRLRDESALRTWLAGWYDHASTAGGPFFVGAAAATRPPGVPIVPPPTITITGVGDLTTTTPSALRIVKVDPSGDIRILERPNDWFAVDTAPLEARGVPVRLTLKSGSAAAPPAGFLVERSARAGRPVFSRVPVPLDSVRNRIDIFFSQSPTDIVAPAVRPLVRPGGSKATNYLFLRNLGDKTRTLAIELSTGGTLQKQTVSIAAGAIEPIVFPVALPASVPAPPTATSPAATALPELTAPLILRVRENGREVYRSQIRPEVRNPSAYARLERAVLIPAGPTTDGRNRIEFHLRGAAGLTVPARVELRLPNLAGATTAGTLRGELPANGELRLFADLPVELSEGVFRCALDIDGIARVYRFQGPSAPPPGPPLTLRQLDAVDLHLALPTGPRTARLMVKVSVDEAPADAELEVALGRLTATGIEADATLRFPTARRTRIGFAPSADGGLEFDAFVEDRIAEFDAGQVRGRRLVRGRLLSATGEEIATATLPLVLDDRPPQKVVVLNLPRKAQLGTKLTVKAGGLSDVSGIREVQFFLGKPLEGKIPPGSVVVDGAAANPERTLWSSELTLPKEKPGPLDVSVRFVSGTGMDAYGTASLELVDYDPAKSEPGIIQGVVAIGTAAQPGVEVTLVNSKGAVVKQAKTDSKGLFQFDGMAPGEYAVQSSRRISGADKVGSAAAKVVAGGRVAVRIELYLK